MLITIIFIDNFISSLYYLASYIYLSDLYFSIHHSLHVIHFFSLFLVVGNIAFYEPIVNNKEINFSSSNRHYELYNIEAIKFFLSLYNRFYYKFTFQLGIQWYFEEKTTFSKCPFSTGDKSVTLYTPTYLIHSKSLNGYVVCPLKYY